MINSKIFLFPKFVAFGLLSSACLSSIQDEDHSPESAPLFSYSGSSGPEHWADLDPAFEACGSGESQSPINIENVKEVDLPNIEFNYLPSMISLVNNGHTVLAKLDQGSYLEVDGEKYELLQFHFHAPSEHEINGQSFPVELHFVHKNEAGHLAVVGIMLVEGTTNASLRPILENIPVEAGREAALENLINASDLLPIEQTTYRYSGSLTTPPCTEGVSWFVMVNPVEISQEQITAFEQVYSRTNRPLQPLNNRQVVTDSTP